jgi:hypothetical protein
MQVLEGRQRPQARSEDHAASASDPLDLRIKRIFEGNSAHTPERTADKSGVLQSRVDITLSLGWSRTCETTAGINHPIGADHCYDFAALDQISRKELDSTINSKSEAAALQKKWLDKPLSLLARHGTKIDVRQFHKQWYHHEACSVCGGHRNHICHSCQGGMTQCTSCGGQRGRYGMMGGISHKVWLSCAGCNGQGRVNCGYCRGSARIDCTGCRASGRRTVVYDAKITAKVHVAHTFVGADVDGARVSMTKLLLENLLKQSRLSAVQGTPSAEGVRLSIEASTPYSCRTYDIDRWTFNFCAVGRDNLIPDMPPIMDRVLGDLTTKLLEETDPARIHALTSESAFTSDLLRAVSGSDGYDLASFKKQYENSMSKDLLDNLRSSVKSGYDGVAGASGRRIWIRSAIGSNIGLFALHETGLFSTLVKLVSGPPTPTSQTMALILLGCAILAAIWGRARFSALREAKRLLSSEVSNCPGMGWAPLGATLATCLTVAYLVSAMQAASTLPQIVTPARASSPPVQPVAVKPPR